MAADINSKWTTPLTRKQFASCATERRSGPLSFAQEGLWFLNQLDPTSPRYNVSRALRFRGKLAIEALHAALNQIVRRHEALRTRFLDADGVPVQVIEPSRPLQLPIIDLSGDSHGEDSISSIFEEEVQRPFDLSSDLMLRTRLVRLTESDHVLLLVIPHITSDGWSMVVLFRELISLYEAFAFGRASALPELPIQYLDYAAWQREWLEREVLREQLSYWSDKLSGVQLLDLPTDHLRTAVQSGRNGAKSFRLSKDLSRQLQALSRAEKSTFFMTLAAAFKALLYRYTNQTDIVIGFPIANRQFVELEGLIGFFANTLVLRSDLSGNPTFRQFLARLREDALMAYEQQDLPFEKLVQELQPERDLSRNPLFQVVFQLRNYPNQLTQIADLTVEPIELSSGIAKFDLSVAMQEEADGLRAGFEYNVDLFESASISRMFGHFESLLRSIVKDPGQRLAELALLTDAERRQVLVEWNATQREYAKGKCIHELFEAQVDKAPDATAVIFAGERLSYRELNCRANRLARFLRNRGVGAETLVAICMTRSIEMIVALLGVLKAGAAYVPLDPAYPRDRISFILADTRAVVLLTEASLIDDMPFGSCNDAVRPSEQSVEQISIHDSPLLVICLDKDSPQISEQSDENLPALAAEENLAYVIYTSGSTGLPKGVMIEHRRAAAFLNWAHSAFTQEDLAGVVASTSICFDLSVFEIFAPLTTGGQVILVENALALAHLDRGVVPTLVNTVPSVMAELLRLGGLPKSIRTVNLAGEPLKASLVEQIHRQTSAQQVYDLYGPSETTTYSTYTRRTADGTQTIGRPIANTQIYILDPHGNPAPIGIPGEIYIGGAGLARGYLNRPELTAEKFIANPFSTEPGARLYRTGDLARYLPDGNIEFLGRLDNQVKIRGFRVELEEIEAVLGQHSSLREAVVLVREDSPGDKRLVAYIVAAAGCATSVNELRRFLQQKLPEYMVPSAFVVLDILPFTPNGKLDRKALPAPEQSTPEPDETFVGPRTAVEDSLANIWAGVLKLDKVGIHDNFFDLGGHSLLATQLIARIRDTFKVNLPLRSLFEAPTIYDIAQRVQELGEKQGAVQEAKITLVAREQYRVQQKK